MAKKITLKNKNGDVLCPHTAIEQVQGLKEALDKKLGKTENVDSANRSKYIETLHLSNGTWYGDNYKAYIQWEDSNTAKLKIDGYFTKTDEAIDAINADKAKTLKTLSVTVQDLNNLSVDSSSVEYYGYLPGSSSNMPTHNAWQNSVMCFGLHSNGATAQMFFSKDNPLYYRSSHTGDWKQLRTMNDLVTTSHIADTAITPAKIQTSIALNGTPSMTVEPTTSSPDRTIASVGLVKKAVDGIEIGGRNLILNSDFSQGTEHWTNVYWGTTISSEENILKADIQQNANQFGVNASPVLLERGQQYIVSFDVRSDSLTSLDYCYLRSSSGNIRLSSINGITSEWQRLECKFSPNQTGIYNFSFGSQNLSTEISQSIEFRKVKLERGSIATDWSPAPEDINTEISNAETRSKAHAEDYTNAEIDKIENGQTVAQKANSLYDDDSGTYKNWGEIDTAITRKIGNKFEDYATKSYVQGEISKQVAVPIASETEYGKVELATPEDVTAVENDNSAVNNSAKAVTPYTLKEYIASKNFATDSDISDAVTAAKPVIFFQAAQPAGGKDGDIWIIP